MPRTKQFNEKEVLKKAMELFWEKGFHATSMQNLVSCLGINRASLYDTFGGKEELFNRAFAEYRSSTQEMLKKLFENEESVKKGLTKLFDKAIEEAKTDTCRKGCFVVNTTTELIPGDEEIHQVLEQNKSDIENLFTSYIQKGIDEGQFHPSQDARSIGLMLYTLYSGLRVVAKVDTNPNKLRATVQTALTILD